MATKKEFRISERFEVIDSFGVRHAITERTEVHIDDAGREAGPCTKEYMIGDRCVVPMDGGTFEMLPTGTRYRRL
jgi:hypothetical protein